MQHATITNELLHDLIEEPISIVELCTRHDLTIEQLHEIIISPAFEQLAAMISAIQRARDTFRLARITEVLERIALSEPTSPSHTETIRKAAAHLDRILRKDAANNTHPHPTPEPTPEPETTPTPDTPTHHDQPNTPQPNRHKPDHPPGPPATDESQQPTHPSTTKHPDHQPRAA